MNGESSGFIMSDTGGTSMNSLDDSWQNYPKSGAMDPIEKVKNPS